MTFKRNFFTVPTLFLSLTLIGCGGGGASGNSGVSNPGPPPPPPIGPAVNANFQFAQTHVLPPEGLNFTTKSQGAVNFHLVANRPALALVKITETDVVGPKLEVLKDGLVVDSFSLAPPSALPASEAGSDGFATDKYSATIPAKWVDQGLFYRVNSSNHLPSVAISPIVGAPSALTIKVLPFYLFGATSANAINLTTATVPTSATYDELLAKWPVASLDIQPHGGVAFSADVLVIAPRGDNAGVAQPAYVLTSTDQQKDGFATLSAAISLAGVVRDANGEGQLATHYYAPVIGLNRTTGRYSAPGGGLGSLGSAVASGDADWAGVFYHEMGHTFGLEHAAAAFTNGNFPYDGGSLKGSVWGYDYIKNLFLSVFIPTTASSYKNCASGHQVDATGRCYKQDPMQGGSGDQASGFRFTMLADAYGALTQRWFEGVTSLGTGGAHTYSGGRIFADGAGGYKRWDSISNAFVPFVVTTTPNAQSGILNGYPAQQNVPVYTIAFTVSNAGTAGATYIYPPLRYTGNLLSLIDPTDSAARASINPSNGVYKWYCVNSGCDYTIKATYADGSVLYRLVKGGFRSFNAPSAAFSANAADPLSSDSFMMRGINLPAVKDLKRVDLLSTPTVWQGMPSSEVIVASRIL